MNNIKSNKFLINQYIKYQLGTWYALGENDVLVHKCIARKHQNIICTFDMTYSLQCNEHTYVNW